MLPAGPVAQTSTPEAEAFVRFCYQRRRVGWPELYDEMCAVAMRGLYQGMGADALAEIGVGFSLFETPRLAQIVLRVVAEEQAARRAAKAGTCPVATAAIAASSAMPVRVVEDPQPASERSRLEAEAGQVLAVPAA
jgi:hypothetical protein